MPFDPVSWGMIEAKSAKRSKGTTTRGEYWSKRLRMHHSDAKTYRKGPVKSLEPLLLLALRHPCPLIQGREA